MSLTRLLKIRKKMKRKKPAFNRQNYKKKKLKTKWVSPRGKDSKLKIYEKPRGTRPSHGYSSPKDVRGLNPSGFKEKLVYKSSDVEKIDPKTHAIVISSTVGRKKRLDIIKSAQLKKIHIVNK